MNKETEKPLKQEDTDASNAAEELLEFSLDDDILDEASLVESEETGEEAKEEKAEEVKRWEDIRQMRLPDDEALPQTYRGQKTLGDVWDERLELTHRLNRQNQLYNEKDQENRILRSTLDKILNSAEKESPGAVRPRSIRELRGIRMERDFPENPDEVIDTLLDGAKEDILNQVESRQREIDDRIKNFEAARQIEGIRGASFKARDIVSKRIGIDISDNDWIKRVGLMTANMVSRQIPMEQMNNPEEWVHAYDDVRTMFSTPAPVQARPPAPAVSSKPASMNKRGKRLSTQFAMRARDLANDFKLDPDEFEKEILKDFEKGDINEY